MFRPAHVMWLPITFLFLTLTLTACGMAGGPVSGTVIDRSTNKPIEGAIVVAYWEGSVFNLVHTTRRCFHVESTTSDKEGKYKIPFWMGMPKGIVDQERHLRAYKPGYDEIGYNKKENVMAMKPFTGTREARLEYIERVMKSTLCGGAGKSQRKLYTFYETLYYEALKITDPDMDKEFLRWLRNVAATAWIAADSDMRMEEHDRLVEEFLRDHLR